MGICSSSSLFNSLGSRARRSQICSLVGCMSVGKGVVVVVKEGEGSPPVLLVAPWVGWFWTVGAGLLLPFNSSLRSSGGGSAGFVWAASLGFVCVSLWDFLSMATAVGDIVGGVFGGEPFVMVRLSAQRRISRPAANLGYGSAGVTGGLGGLLGGVPIVTVSMNFG